MNDRAQVHCNGCTECCQRDLLILHPELGDNPAEYQTMECINPVTGRWALALAHKPEGGCIYLTKDGCSIHERAPAICRKFDCSEFVAKLTAETTRAQRRRMISNGLISANLLKEGKRRLT